MIQYKKQLEKGQLLVDFEGFIAILYFWSKLIESFLAELQYRS